MPPSDFVLTEAHREQYATEGYTVFRSVLPTPLIERLRAACTVVRRVARTEGSPQAQRLQPVQRSDIPQQAFIEYASFPPLRRAVSNLLSPAHAHGDRSVFGVLLEPRDEPWATNWHRDWRDNIEGLDRGRWRAVFHSSLHFNQINCALYNDDCLWVVPGSHLRGDTPDEIARYPTRPIPGPQLSTAHSTRQKVSRCLEYARSMPGAINLKLRAGDFAIYRNTLWHCGVYSPSRPRATIHDGAMTPEFRQWTTESRAQLAQRKKTGLGWAISQHEMPPPLAVSKI